MIWLTQYHVTLECSLERLLGCGLLSDWSAISDDSDLVICVVLCFRVFCKSNGSDSMNYYPRASHVEVQW